MIKFTPERRLTGGLRLPANKVQSTAAGIRSGPLPARLIISTRQHSGSAADPVVQPGQHVTRGECIARASGAGSADVHASSAGQVLAIESRPVPLVSGVQDEVCIVIGTQPGTNAPAAPEPRNTSAITVDMLNRAGIVGLGGAVFPTAAKIESLRQKPCELLIINGAECEPYISCDDMLMREWPDAIIDGTRVLMNLAGASRCIIAIERDKPQAIEAISAAAERAAIPGLRVAELPSIYPAGGERQLLDVLAEQEISSTHYPGDTGYLCQNVGTAYAVSNYCRHGEPLISRVVTVTGGAVAQPGNIHALIGTPIRDLIAACGDYGQAAARIIHGGSMMGFALDSDELPVTKSTNCIIAAVAAEVRQEQYEWPCIRCGECAIACPARLLPQDLLIAARARDNPLLEELNLQECIECGCCDIVCPSHIPLTQVFREAKPVLKQYHAQRAFTALANERFHEREARLAELREVEDQRRTAMKQSLEDSRESAIMAAVQRARQRKHQTDKDAD